MTSKERVLIALSHEEPDRIPINALFVPEMQELLANHLGVSMLEPGENALANDLTGRIGCVLGNDLVKVQAGMECMFYSGDEPEYTTDWGVTLRRIPNPSGMYTENGHTAGGQ